MSAIIGSVCRNFGLNDVKIKAGVSRYDAGVDKLEIFQKLATDVAKGELAFPTSAQVALRVRQALENPDCHIDQAAKLVQAEPLLSARVVAIANSVAYNSAGREITEVKAAVTRLGFATVRTLATALLTRQLAGNPAGEPARSLSIKLWEHTAHVAALARVLARRVTRQNPETALFAGIVHDVGGFYMLSRAGDFPGLLEGDMLPWMEQGRMLVGRAVLQTLGVPDAIREAIEAYWDGFLSIPPVNLADTLLLAEALAPVSSPLEGQGNGDGKAAGGRDASIDMAIGEEMLSAILAESETEVSSLTRALQF